VTCAKRDEAQIATLNYSLLIGIGNTVSKSKLG